MSITLSSATTDDQSLTCADIAAAYPGYQRITKDAVFVNPELAMLCRGASEQEVQAARVKYGPHANTAVVVYMNDLAATAFRAKAAYPTGSVVVKEKKLGSHSNEQGKQVADGDDGVGGMIKRPAGYNPEHGDWEYFYFDQSAAHVQSEAMKPPFKVEHGQIASCVQCHDAAKRTDYVFGAWENPHNPFAVPTQIKLR